MDFITIKYWDEAIWLKVRDIYNEAFGDHGGKPEKIIRNMFAKQLCSLHIAMIDNDVAAMALTGSLNGSRILLIDYLAVQKNFRGHGFGKQFVNYLVKWALLKAKYDFLLLEAECDTTSENLNRIHFWEKCGFKLVNDYIHQYIWVPEPYMAMVHALYSGTEIPDSGKTLFKYIGKFHKDSFRQK